tara:strand:- start:78 stop:296 length:219 start_codon:yes stop_codon:yes gene_type:complete
VKYAISEGVRTIIIGDFGIVRPARHEVSQSSRADIVLNLLPTYKMVCAANTINLIAMDEKDSVICSAFEHLK